MASHRILSFALFLSLFAGLNTAGALAGPACTIIVEAQSGEVIYQDGSCGTPGTPESTFKIVLSLIGYDTGYLKDATTPALPYKPEYKAMMESWQVTTDPTIWMEDSVVWYSQEFTKQLGAERFQTYVDDFGYGNRDLSGEPGRNNGLTNAWLGTSLKISPVEQTVFLRRMLDYKLPVSRAAVDRTIAIIPTFPADNDWTVHGKTGSGLLRGADGKFDRNRQIGWFVGWATKDERTVVFATIVRDDEKTDDRAGVRIRSQFIDQIPALLAK